MNEQPVVFASVHTVRDYAHWQAMNNAENHRLQASGVLRRWSYQSLNKPSQVFSGLLVRTAAEALAILNNRRMADWLAEAGVDEVPPFFVGARVASYDFTGGQGVDGAFIVAAVHSVPDFDRWLQAVDDDLDRLAGNGTRHLWLYRAVDDPLEVMMMMALRSEAAARALVAQGEARQDWFDTSGLHVHPGVFVGRRTDFIDFIGETQPAR
jgi:hypothetical protein